MFLLIYNGNLSLMNIRDIIFINKAKSSDRIKILDLLGFETDTVITHNPENYRSPSNFEKSLTIDSFEENLEVIATKEKSSSIDLYIKETENVYTDINKVDNTDDQLPTSAFKPINVTNKIKKIWSDVESRRQWVMPLTIIILTSALLGTAVGTFRSRSANLEQVIATNTLIADDTNRLIEGLANVLEISTDTFYSKYDISNASAYLQSVESSALEYKNLLLLNDEIPQQELNAKQSNLEIIFKFIDDLDGLLTYRILVSEILIYDSLLTIDENTEIDLLTTSLSEITAISKRNYQDLPNIEELNNHKNLINTAIITAEDLHGRLLAALRNNEYEVVNSIASALLLNKETELNAFEKSLNIFDDNKKIVFNSIRNLD